MVTQLSREKVRNCSIDSINSNSYSIIFSEQKKLNSTLEDVDLNPAEIEPELEEDIFVDFD